MTNNEKPLQQKLSSTQENFPSLNEELLENVAGAGLSISRNQPRKQITPMLPVVTEKGEPVPLHLVMKKWESDHPTPKDRANPRYTLHTEQLDSNTWIVFHIPRRSQ